MKGKNSNWKRNLWAFSHRRDEEEGSREEEGSCVD